MPNESKTDLMAALASLKKKDHKAFSALLRTLNVERWSEIKDSQFPEAISTCQAHLGDAEENDGDEMIAEFSEDDDAPAAKLSVRDRLDRDGLDRNAKSTNNVADTGDLRTIIDGAPSLAEGFARASAALMLREKNRATAK